jgi:hypothetical protein
MLWLTDNDGGICTRMFVHSVESIGIVTQFCWRQPALSVILGLDAYQAHYFAKALIYKSSLVPP